MENNNEFYTLVPTVLYENEHYTVQPVEVARGDIYILDHFGCPYSAGYGMVSRKTGQVELIRTCLPDVIYNAEHMSNILRTEPYKWPDMMGEDNEVPEGKVN